MTKDEDRSTVYIGVPPLGNGMITLVAKPNDWFLCTYCVLCKQSQEIDEFKRLISPLTSQSVAKQSVQALSDELFTFKV